MKVFILFLEFFCKSSEIKVESTPLDKKVPIGTSDIDLEITLSDNKFSHVVV